MNINWNAAFHIDPKTLDPFSIHGIPAPVYGNYGGPNWSAGEVGGTTPETPIPPPVDGLDLEFYEHDLVYQHYEDGVIPDPAQLVAADVQLVKDMNALTYTDPGAPDYDPEAGLYEGLATLGIVAKLAVSGDLQNLEPFDQLAIFVATQEAVVNFEAGLAEVPGEARSLHGALHVFEAKFSDLLGFDLL